MYESHQTEQYKAIHYQDRQTFLHKDLQVTGYTKIQFTYDIYMNEFEGEEFWELEECKVNFGFGVGNPAYVTFHTTDLKTLELMGFPLEEVLEETRHELGAVKKLARS